MKKNLKIIIITISLSIIFVLLFYLWWIYRGIKPSLLPPPEDVTKLIPEAKERLPKAEEEKEEKVIKGKPVEFPLTLSLDFEISIYAKDLGPSRVVSLDKNGQLYVSVTGEGKVFSLRDKDRDGFAEENLEVLSGLKNPHGIAFFENYFYVAEEDKITRFLYDDKESRIKDLGEKIVDLPLGDQHFTRTLAFGPDGRLFVSVGSTCDVCYEKDERLAAVLVMEPDGKNAKVYARGLRNAVFIAFRPGIPPELWGTEMGRDWLGDDLPPDEINIIKEGKDYGWPRCYGNKVHDLDFDRGALLNPCPETEPPVIEIPAHSAPLGLAFMDDRFGQDFFGDLFVAYHGSWNRSVPTGYKIVRFDFDPKTNSFGRQEDFISGWLTEDGRALGRPVDIKLGKDKAMYISDDKAGVIYKVTKK